MISTQVSIITDSPERLKKSESDIPMGRLARPEEIAGAVSYLLSPDASFTHGANIRVAGGRGPGAGYIAPSEAAGRGARAGADFGARVHSHMYEYEYTCTTCRFIVS